MKYQVLIRTALACNYVRFSLAMFILLNYSSTVSISHRTLRNYGTTQRAFIVESSSSRKHEWQADGVCNSGSGYWDFPPCWFVFVGPQI